MAAFGSAQSAMGAPRIRPNASPISVLFAFAALARGAASGAASDTAQASPRVVVRIERLLLRPQRFRDVLEVDADAGPGRRAAAHRIDQNVGRLQMRRRPGMARLPALEPCERLFPLLRARDLDQRL